MAALSAGAATAAAPAPASSVGVVDTDRVSGEYRAMQTLNQQYLEFQKLQEAQILRRQKSRMLFDQELREYLDLSSPTAAPTAERDKRLTEMEKASDDRSKRLLDLGQRKDRTADEDGEYQRLDATYKQRTQELSAIQSDVQRVVEAKQNELMKIITESFNAAVKAVANEKKLPVVMRREIVLFGGTDITEDVITKLNQQPMPAISMTPAGVGAAAAAPAADAKPAGK
jgi:Skp family chaperone for outer membrane proteins